MQDPPGAVRRLEAERHPPVGVAIEARAPFNELANVPRPVLDQNVHISEYKTSTCDIRPGRRPHGPALRALVDDYRRRAGVETG